MVCIVANSLLALKTSTMELNEKLKQLRQSRKIKQAAMAEMLGITQQAYSKWENYKVDFSTHELKAICKILDVDIAYFLSEDYIPPPRKMKQTSLIYILICFVAECFTLVQQHGGL
jgi:transcriptional regulator with XRE-family HTH domain